MRKSNIPKNHETLRDEQKMSDLDSFDITESPISFNFYQDQMPYNKLGSINVTIQYYYENIVITQLLKNPVTDRFAVAFYVQ